MNVGERNPCDDDDHAAWLRRMVYPVFIPATEVNCPMCKFRETFPTRDSAIEAAREHLREKHA